MKLKTQTTTPKISRQRNLQKGIVGDIILVKIFLWLRQACPILAKFDNSPGY
jgi:hypothetical protein